jgi:hypothetical protein
MNLPLPDREVLRRLYDEAIIEIGKSRPGINLTAGFYAETGDSVFDAGYLALSDHAKGTKRLNVVSAPSGGGKTTYAFAFMTALTRYAERTQGEPFGCVFVADQITRCDAAYRELNALMPGKVAVWTTEHDPKCEDRTRVLSPAATFTKNDLQRFPVIVTTHHFYNGAQGHKAQMWSPDDDVFSPHKRALAIVDERPEEVEIYETTLREAQAVKEAVQVKIPEISDHVERLWLLMVPHDLDAKRQSVRAPDREAAETLLGWFASDEADRIAKSYASIPGLAQLFGFARSMTLGCAFAAPTGNLVQFVGWQAKLIVKPGTVLLDATADIDGVSQVCPWREHVHIPKAQYRKLKVVHVPQHTKRRLKEFLAKASNQHRYVDWMVQTIKDHMAPGEYGLVVCKKALFDAQRVPRWGDRDPRFDDPQSYMERYEWDIDGRKLCAIHWGIGIGSNSWMKASTVFLFDEFFIPKRVAVATVQGLRGHRADEGDLGSMRTMRSKAPGVELISEGHRLRWCKQLALRGSGRCYDELGQCGDQKLVVASETKTFLANARRLFPGAPITAKDTGTKTGKTTKADAVIRALSRPDVPATISANEIAQRVGTPWRNMASDVMTPQFVTSLEAIGWAYVKGRGRAGSHFERIPADQLLAA